LSLELIQVRVGGEKAILNRVFGVRGVPQHPEGLSVEGGKAAWQNAPKRLSCSFTARDFKRSVSPDICIRVGHALAFLWIGRPAGDQLAVYGQPAVIGTNDTGDHPVSVLQSWMQYVCQTKESHNSIDFQDAWERAEQKESTLLNAESTDHENEKQEMTRTIPG
jgi:hypothetical protein